MDFYESREWMDLRYRALKRSSGMCQCCGHRGDKLNPLQVDHIKPRSKFPALELKLDNLQVLCRDCNMGKGARDSTDWRFVPSKELSVLNNIDPARRFRLQQLGWLKINGESKQVRLEAHKEYRRLWRECEQEWLSSREAAQ
jgi:rubredoxin